MGRGGARVVKRFTSNLFLFILLLGLLVLPVGSLAIGSIKTSGNEVMSVTQKRLKEVTEEEVAEETTESEKIEVDVTDEENATDKRQEDMFFGPIQKTN